MRDSWGLEHIVRDRGAVGFLDSLLRCLSNLFPLCNCLRPHVPLCVLATLRR